MAVFFVAPERAVAWTLTEPPPLPYSLNPFTFPLCRDDATTAATLRNRRENCARFDHQLLDSLHSMAEAH